MKKRIAPILFKYRHEPKFQLQLMVKRVYDWCSPMKVISMFDNTKESLSDFLEEIHTGKIQLPDLQRSYTWCNDQIVKLIASISLSFPIGAILTIQVKNNSSTFKPRLVEGVQLDQPCLPESLILDGQQRSTTAYMCLRSGRSVMIRDRKTHKIQERYYYIDIAAALNPEIDRVEAIISLPSSQIQKTRDSAMRAPKGIDTSTAPPPIKNSSSSCSPSPTSSPLPIGAKASKNTGTTNPKNST